MKTLLRSSKLRMAIWTGLCFSLPLTTWAATDCTATAVTQIGQAQCDTLLSIYNDTGGNTAWTHKTGWNETDTPCLWQSLTGMGHNVTKFEPSNHNFSGGITI